MRKRFGKFLATFVSVMLCVSLVPVAAIAADPSDASDAALINEPNANSIDAEDPEAPEASNSSNSEEIEAGEPEISCSNEPASEEASDGAAAVAMFADEVAVQSDEGVASVNGTPYDTLQAAVDAATDKATILLKQDVFECIKVNQTKNITLDLQGHMIDAQKEDVCFEVVANGCSITVLNGKMTNGKNSGSWGTSAFRAANVNKAIRLDGVRFENNDQSGGYAITVGPTSSSASYGTVNITNCVITGNCGGFNTRTTDSITLDNVQIFNNKPSSTNSYEAILIQSSNNNKNEILIKDTQIHGNGGEKQNKSIVKLSKGTYRLQGCSIRDNTVKTTYNAAVAGIERDHSTSLTLIDTVIANNTFLGNMKSSQTKVYGAGIGCLMGYSSSSAGKLTINGGAVYGNTKAGVPNDIALATKNCAESYETIKILAADQMSDSTIGGNAFFKNHAYEWGVVDSAMLKDATYNFNLDSVSSAISSDGSILIKSGVLVFTKTTGDATASYAAFQTKEPQKVASVGDKEYESLSEAFKAANSGDTVKLHFAEGADKSIALSVTESAPIPINKNVTFDSNGGITSGNVAFQISSGSEFSLVNSEEGLSANDGFVLGNEGIVNLGDGIDVKSISNTGDGVLKIEGTHDVLNVAAENDKPIYLAEGTTYTAFNLTLADEKMKAINNGSMSDDLTLVECDSEAEADALLASGLFYVVGKSNPLAKIVVDGKKIMIHMIDATAVYVGGSKAKDEEGYGLTPELPVASFDRAKALLDTNGLRDKRIFVVGEIVIKGSEAWTLENSELVRYPDYKGVFVRILPGATLTLKAVTLNGGSYSMENRIKKENMNNDLEEGVSANAPLVVVEKGASLVVSDDALLHSNQNEGSIRGGAINNAGLLEIRGGTITDNSTIESGGGIMSNGVVEMSGGSVTNNESTEFIGQKNIKSSGGGICIGSNGEMTLEGGLIASNKTTGLWGFGGGIALSTTSACTNMILTMTGGTVKDNESRGNGGGIAVWSGAKATITSGVIHNNRTLVTESPTETREAYFGGGGIYVNKNASLHLENVEITENTSSSGSALAACPTSDVHLYVRDGAVIHDNYSSAFSDIYISAMLGGSHEVPVSISPYTLEGYKYNWTHYNGPQYYKTAEINRVLPAGKSLELVGHLGKDEVKEAVKRCKLTISHNYCGKSYTDSDHRGGAIGCNGTLTIGNPDTHFVLEKKVSDDSDDQVVKDLLGTSIEDAEFEFEITLTDPEGAAYANQNIEYYKYGMKESFTTNEEGKVWIKLKKDEYIFASGIPNGVSYKIVETTFASAIDVETSIVITDKDDPRYVETDVSGFLADLISGGEKNDKDEVIAYGLNEVVVTNEYVLSGFDLIKELKGAVYDSDNPKVGNATAIFHVEGFANEDDARAVEPTEGASKFYDNFVSMNFDREGTETLSLRDLPVGAWFKVTEVSFDGDGYHIDSESNAMKIFKLEKIMKDDGGNELVVQVFKFTNVSDEEETPNQGVINRYNFTKNGNSVNDLPFNYDQDLAA